MVMNDDDDGCTSSVMKTLIHEDGEHIRVGYMKE